MRSPQRGSSAAWLFVSLCGVLCACAPMVTSTPAALRPAAEFTAPSEIAVLRAAEFRLATGYSRTIPAQSRWRRVGSLPEGDVYRPLDGAFALEGRQVHEAYLVVANGVLRGFYLPAESAFSPLSPEVPLTLGGSR